MLSVYIDAADFKAKIIISCADILNKSFHSKHTGRKRDRIKCVIPAPPEKTGIQPPKTGAIDCRYCASAVSCYNYLWHMPITNTEGDRRGKTVQEKARILRALLPALCAGRHSGKRFAAGGNDRRRARVGAADRP